MTSPVGWVRRDSAPAFKVPYRDVGSPAERAIRGWWEARYGDPLYIACGVPRLPSPRWSYAPDCDVARAKECGDITCGFGVWSSLERDIRGWGENENAMDDCLYIAHGTRVALFGAVTPLADPRGGFDALRGAGRLFGLGQRRPDPPAQVAFRGMQGASAQGPKCDAGQLPSQGWADLPTRWAASHA